MRDPSPTPPNGTETVWTGSWRGWPACCRSLRRWPPAWTNSPSSAWASATSGPRTSSQVHFAGKTLALTFPNAIPFHYLLSTMHKTRYNYNGIWIPILYLQKKKWYILLDKLCPATTVTTLHKHRHSRTWNNFLFDKLYVGEQHQHPIG